jgi:hypothetical protein
MLSPKIVTTRLIVGRQAALFLWAADRDKARRFD